MHEPYFHHDLFRGVESKMMYIMVFFMYIVNFSFQDVHALYCIV